MEMSEIEWIKFNDECKKYVNPVCNTSVAERKKEAVAYNVVCVKCGSNQLSKTRQQVRSADEGMTTFYRCMSCSHIFYF